MKIIEKFIKKFQKFLKITHGSNLNLVTNQLRTTFWFATRFGSVREIFREPPNPSSHLLIII